VAAGCGAFDGFRGMAVCRFILARRIHTFRLWGRIKRTKGARGDTGGRERFTRFPLETG
jgi:hypothetical protein